jgi:hypothetical protein
VPDYQTGQIDEPNRREEMTHDRENEEIHPSCECIGEDEKKVD